ncbi:MAG: PhzF family phenazine biosynthesis protein [Chloroflexi bacterium]|nr:PhzF family phenazine biosynthesis protein [Chloroflexota bacterium]
MGQLTFYIVDVFAEEKYAGNQLAVFRGGQALSDAEMQRIALEMNYSETTFILSETPRDGGFDVRIFTPKEEVPFAGHPTLGTAHILRTEVLRGAADKILLNLKVGQIPVTLSAGVGSGTYWMKQIEPTFGPRLTPETVAPILSLTPDEIDPRLPIEQVSTGLPFFIVPLKTLASLKRAQTVKDKFFELIANTEAKSILIFCPEPHRPENDISVRVFVDYFGIPEDPATGSGNGCLAGYLVKHRYWGRPEIDVKVEQGYEIGRPSLLLLRASEKDGHISVSVGGRALTIARGEFL